MNNFKISVDADGIALILFDVPGRSMNTLTTEAIEDVAAFTARIREDDSIRGAVLASAKASGFCGGADLGDLIGQAGERIAAPPISAYYRALEKCGKPVAIAIEGVCVGGGLELALACHYRIAADSPKVRLGLPEVTIGLLPGAGGTQRLSRLVGAAKALPLLLEGRLVGAGEAKDLGFVDEVRPVGETVDAAKAWVRDRGDPVARWDRKDFRLPGGGPYTPAGAQTFITANAMLRKRTHGNYPAAEFILKSVFEGVQLPIDAALRVETRYFLNTFATPQARAMIRTLFLSKQQLSKGGVRPAGVEKSRPVKVGVVGAGMMGAGVAYVQAAKGIETVLVDVSPEAAGRGKAYSIGLVEKAVAKGKLAEAAGRALLDRILPTTDYAALDGADIVIEAVFEDQALKADVAKRIEAVVSKDALVGSNTSTLPITGLAEASSRPGHFIGIHFFSPVDRMDLVEIIRGEKTSDEAVAKAIDYVLAIGKTPIVVRDGRGFYTSRCFGTYIYEGLEMLSEGVPPALIDNIGRMTGMPRGPLELTDDIAIDLTLKIAEQTKEALGEAYDRRPYETIIEKLVSGGRLGRKNGRGFYDYPENAPKRLWRGLSDIAPPKETIVDDALIKELRERLLFRQAIEAVRCFDEGVVTDAREADVGAVMGWGFAPWTGGPLNLIDGMGARAFVEACDALAAGHGKRFEPPPGLRERASRGKEYYEHAAA